MKSFALGLFVLMSAVSAAAGAEEALAPFVADYDVRYGRIGVGTSRTELSRAGSRWVMQSTTNATGLARLIASGTLKQRS